MGFDFYIQLCLNLCDATGKPYIFNEKSEKDYVLPNIVIPEQHRRFLKLRGRFLHIYTDDLNDHNIFSADVDALLEKFPDWDEIKNDEFYSECVEEYEWTEDDHNKFKAALEWLQNQPYHYSASWSY